MRSAAMQAQLRRHLLRHATAATHRCVLIAPLTSNICAVAAIAAPRAATPAAAFARTFHRSVARAADEPLTDAEQARLEKAGKFVAQTLPTKEGEAAAGAEGGADATTSGAKFNPFLRREKVEYVALEKDPRPRWERRRQFKRLPQPGGAPGAIDLSKSYVEIQEEEQRAADEGVMPGADPDFDPEAEGLADLDKEIDQLTTTPDATPAVEKWWAKQQAQMDKTRAQLDKLTLEAEIEAEARATGKPIEEIRAQYPDPDEVIDEAEEGEVEDDALTADAEGAEDPQVAEAVVNTQNRMELEELDQEEAAMAAKAAAKEAARATKPKFKTYYRVKKTATEDPLGHFLAQLKMSDHAEKFPDLQSVFAATSRDLKEMGLTVVQRKRFLKLVDRTKTQLRANSALALIRNEGLRLTPAELQKRVYEIMYAHVYEANRVRAHNVEAVKEWRAPLEEYRIKRLDEHNNLRGLREPELMEMAKFEAYQIATARDYIEKYGPKPKERDERVDEKEDEQDENGQEEGQEETEGRRNERQ